MAEHDYSKILDLSIYNLSTEESLRGLFHQRCGRHLPSVRAINEIMELCRAIIFPSYFGSSKINLKTVRYHIGVNTERLFELLTDQVFAALCFAASNSESDPRQNVVPCRECSKSETCVYDILRQQMEEDTRRLQQEQVQSVIKTANPEQKEITLPEADINFAVEEHMSDVEEDAFRAKARYIAASFINALPELRFRLGLDAKSAFLADPAATSLGEVICCYPGVRAVMNYRIAHQLLTLGVPLIPRAITEMAHSETGIDIHPGARIGSCFSIDHGTGVVIGETCIIGNNVQLFQGVTLGAKTIPVDETGKPLKIARHPILEDDVVVYSNATILGRITIGKGTIIGGNVWVTYDVPAGSKIVQSKAHAPSRGESLRLQVDEKKDHK